MLKRFNISKRALFAIILLCASVFSGVALIMKYTHLKTELSTMHAEETYMRELYRRQNLAFEMRIAEIYVPYAELQESLGEERLYMRITWYNYRTGSDFTLYDVWDYLSSVYVIEKGSYTDTRKVYTNYERIKAYVDFVNEMDEIGVLDMFYNQWNEVYQQMVTEYPEMKKYRQRVTEYPEMGEYTRAALPFQLIDEIVHKIVDTSYEMNLEITDERNYMYITPEAMEKAPGNK